MLKSSKATKGEKHQIKASQQPSGLLKAKSAAPPVSHRTATSTTKLAEIVAESSDSPFKLHKRMPGWRSDCAYELTGQCCQTFLEETIGTDNSVPAPIPFNVQLDDNNPVSWLGGTIPDPHSSPNSVDGQYIDVIRSVANLARNYNATLYSLRRFHYYKKFSRDDMPVNKTNPEDPETFGDLTPDVFNSKASIAESQWREAAEKLDAYLDSKPHGFALIVDMIEVNGYIVSIRVVTSKKGKLEEIDGSSSQVSLSSAFSYSK